MERKTMNDKKKIIDGWHSWVITATRFDGNKVEDVNITVDFCMMNPELVEEIENGIAKIPTNGDVFELPLVESEIEVEV